MNKIAIFGGSFNPPHMGHYKNLCELQKQERFDKIVIVPIKKHPLDKHLIDAKYRLEMCKLTFKDSFFEIDEFEINRNEISYTIDTVNYFLRKYNNIVDLHIIIGLDNYLILSKWKKYQEILTKTKIIVLNRAMQTNIPSIYNEKISFFNNTIINISSTNIRKGFFHHDSIAPEVLSYMKIHNLYPSIV